MVNWCTLSAQAMTPCGWKVATSRPASNCWVIIAGTTATRKDRFVGHGMSCAGIIAAKGKHMPAGLGGASRIIPMRALAAAKLPGKDQAVGLGAISDLDMAMKIAIDLGAKVINMSFGTDDSALAPGSPKPHADIVDYALARGCILIAASGKQRTGKPVYWPAAYPGVIAVGAVNAARTPTRFSTRGRHVALCAPGDKILTTGLEGYQFADRYQLRCTLCFRCGVSARGKGLATRPPHKCRYGTPAYCSAQYSLFPMEIPKGPAPEFWTPLRRSAQWMPK